MRRYSASGSDTNTASTTIFGVTASTSTRCRIFDLLIGSAATPADSAAQYQLKRYTAAGTATSFTPIALDPGDPAALCSSGFAHTVEPTYTANSQLLDFSVNQRATFRWVAAPDSEIVLPATSANGVGLFVNAVGGTPVSTQVTALWQE